ncbi:hypothetical protein ACFOLJ_12270 [Rugamonas sp. CCM 8940]|uniref:hypothetical protein n=1 Tax=Rugamonas sp. CCM 8940 TaxID=2765359 RepID=UPI0018F5D147|nr:hypothetical protein [Rugamonas sp. CCM 8940]MBJ7314034.1 hypothetical protein [Rugamonas sp. CCM 8940]
MATTLTESKTDTSKPMHDDGKTRLPHERDETPEGRPVKPREVIRQAASDIEQGLVDTDRHATPGVETVRPASAGQAKPLPGDKRD